MPPTSPWSPIFGRCFAAMSVMAPPLVDALPLRSSRTDALPLFMLDSRWILFYHGFIPSVGIHCVDVIFVYRFSRLGLYAEGPSTFASFFSSCFGLVACLSVACTQSPYCLCHSLSLWVFLCKRLNLLLMKHVSRNMFSQKRINLSVLKFKTTCLHGGQL